VIRVLHARFYLDAIDGIPSVLMMDPDGDGAAAAEPLADYIEDFQVAAGIDESEDTIIGADEWGFSGVVGTPATFTINRDLRGLRVSLVARAPGSLVATTATYVRPALEDHAAGTAPDTLRRRVLSSTVDIRNLKGSP
jgi:hypothetical protein